MALTDLALPPELLFSLLDQAPTAVLLTQGPAHRIAFANALALNILGRGPEIIDRPARDAVPEVAGQGYLEVLDQVFNSGEPYTVREARVVIGRQGDGGLEEIYCTFSYQPVRAADGTITGVFANGYEVTEQVRERERAEALAAENAALLLQAQAGEQSRATERDRLQQILDQLPEAVLVADEGGVFWLANAAAQAISGLARGSGPPLVDVNHYDMFGVRRMDGSLYPGRELPAARALLQGEEVRGEQLLVPLAGTGELLPLLANAAPLRDASGAITGAVTVFQDISVLREMDRQKDEFLGLISHDLRAPLTSITGLAGLLRRQLSRTGGVPSDRLESVVNLIAEAATRMRAMVDELLDLTRLQMGRTMELQREPVDLVQLVRATAELQQKAGERQQIYVEATLPELSGEWDRARVERVVSNVLSNAIKYSPDGGPIEVTIDREPGSPAWAILHVRDRGIGIPAADLPHVFERFYRGSNHGGTIAGAGIGLSGAKWVVEAHGGEIAIESREGEGTLVTIRLPLPE